MTEITNYMPFRDEFDYEDDHYAEYFMMDLELNDNIDE